MSSLFKSPPGAPSPDSSEQKRRARERRLEQMSMEARARGRRGSLLSGQGEGSLDTGNIGRKTLLGGDSDG